MRTCKRGLHEIPENSKRCQPCHNANRHKYKGRSERAVIQGELCPDWLDPVAVERALKGIPVGRPLTAREKAEVARVATEDDGMSYSAVAHILGLNGTAMRLLRSKQ